MEHLEPAIRKEYDRWRELIGPHDPYQGPLTVGIHEVLRAHFLIVDYFVSTQREGVGGIGPRDLDRLHSALGRQHVALGTQPKWNDIFSLSATLFYGLVLDHAFWDANKRTAFLVALHQLQHRGRVPNCTSRDFERLALRVASHDLQAYADYAGGTNDDDAAVRFIAKFFKSHTRELDKQQYLITYRQLDTVLKRFGFELGDPAGNYIDVFRVEEVPVRKFFVRTGTRVTKKRVTQVGFPGWKSQVGKAAIGSIRKATGLVPEHGVDSKVFYRDLDPLESLIPTYHGSLQRLANK